MSESLKTWRPLNEFDANDRRVDDSEAAHADLDEALAGLLRHAGHPSESAADHEAASDEDSLDWAADEPSRANELLPMIESSWQRCLALGERPDLEGAVAGRGSHLAAGNLALLCDLLERPNDAARYRAWAATHCVSSEAALQ